MPNEPQPQGPGPSFAPAHHRHTGAILGVLIVVLIIILGALYLWGSMLTGEQVQAPVERSIPNNEPETPRATADRQILETTSPSDELDAIVADLESTDLSSLDSEMTQIEAELNAAY